MVVLVFCSMASVIHYGIDDRGVHYAEIEMMMDRIRDRSSRLFV